MIAGCAYVAGMCCLILAAEAGVRVGPALLFVGGVLCASGLVALNL